MLRATMVVACNQGMLRVMKAWCVQQWLLHAIKACCVRRRHGACNQGILCCDHVLQSATECTLEAV
eukprot:1050771-Pelagomonas_calceolata.AAC.6